MKHHKVLFLLGCLLFLSLSSFASPAPDAAQTPASVVIRLHLSSNDEVRKDLAYYLKGELELLEGVTVTESGDVPADYLLDVMEVNEPLGRMALSAAFIRPFTQKDNFAAYRKLLADHWKGGLKDPEWNAFGDYFKPYGVTVSRQLLTNRKGKMRELCASVAATFAKDVLKRPDETAAETPEK